MKNKKKLKGHEIVWTCDFCGEEFKTKKESDKHELTCKKNKNREILLRIKIPDKQTLFVLVSVFIGIYLFTFVIANSYAKTNSLGKKYLTNPLMWFSSEREKEITLTPIPTIEIIPTITPKPKVQNKTNTGDTESQIDCIGPDGKQFRTTMAGCNALNEKWGKTVDYMVDCNMSERCGGGTIRIKNSECINGSCCELNSGWKFLNRDICKASQNSENGPSTYTIRTPQGQEKTCKAEGIEDIGTYMKLMTQYLKEYNVTGNESSLDTGIKYEEKYYEAITRYCTP